ncbi:MAG: FimV/HubP family polar landmark protein, partial [Acidiferrobacterales bacterium]
RRPRARRPDRGDLAADEPAVAEEPSFSDTADDVAAAGLEDDAGVAALDLSDAADAGVDFDISEDTAEGDLAVAEDVSADAASDSGDVQWDLDSDSAEEAVAEVAADAGPSTDDSQQWDETATKLDLAKAYVDMGDAEGARSILDEVLAEGNDEQKKQAAELAAQLG